MRNRLLRFSHRVKVAIPAALLALASMALALEGQIVIHDPSTVIQCDGRFYTYGTGGTALVSDDGWTWRQGVTPSKRGAAPDVVKLADRYCLYVATSTVQPQADIHMIWTKSLDPASPDYKWEVGGIVASSDGIEDCNAIDPGLLLDPTDGRLWMVYGSYFGYIRLVELDPKTGKRLHPGDQPINLAVNCEAATLIHHEGWYYLLATHGSCCRGADSGYNIRVGRSRKVTGPYVDHVGVDMIRGGGTLLIGSGGRMIGPGHFGLIDLSPGVQKFSLHWEADLDRGGASVLDIRPLLWKDGWPVAGDHVRAGTYTIESARTGTALELAVEGEPVGGRIVRGPRPQPPAPGSGAPPAAAPPLGAGGAGMFAGRGGVIPPQDVAKVSVKWPAGPVDVRMANYLCQSQQQWAITPADGAGGYPGEPYFRISIAGTTRTLAVSSDAELVALPEFTGAPEQLWRLDQLPDGTWRISPRQVPGRTEALALSAIGSSFATLSPYDPSSDKQRWLLRMP